MAGNAEFESILNCETCHKTWDRRGLLPRQRRKYRASFKPFARRKACEACVQAKTRCCYSQPSCTRCSKRGIRCQYINSSTFGDMEEDIRDPSSDHLLNHDSLTSPTKQSSSTSSRNYPVEPLALQTVSKPIRTSDQIQNIKLSAVPPIPTEVVGMGFVQEPVTNTRERASLSRILTAPSPSAVYPLTGYPSAATVVDSSRDDLLSHSHGAPTLNGMGLGPIVMPNVTSLSRTTFGPQSILQLLDQYPSLLLEEDFRTPVLHFGMYGDDSPDITVLHLTTMAVSCGRGLLLKDSSRFMKRAMTGERQRLIEQYPSYTCIQQWDALHAMALYEILEQRENLNEGTEHWRLSHSVHGLQAPFILKMARSYATFYPGLKTANVCYFENPDSAPDKALNGTWHRWRITETARRTLFLLNILNWICYHDKSTGRQNAYYEPLSDDLILNMPLPCNHNAWVARDKYEWRVAINDQASQRPIIIETSDSSQMTIDAGQTLKDVLMSRTPTRSQTTIYNLSRQPPQSEQKTKAGLYNSAQLSCFIVLAACLQFPVGTIKN